MRGLARGGGRVVQRAAAAAGGLDREAHQIFVPPRKAQMHAAVPADAEQFVTARAAPFRVRSGGLGIRGAGPTRRGCLARRKGSRHGRAPLD